MPVMTARTPSPTQSGSSIPMDTTPMTWRDLSFWKSSTWKRIRQKIAETEKSEITPYRNLIFRSMIETRLQDVRVVFLSPEPYAEYGVANGLAFSAFSSVRNGKFDLEGMPYQFQEIVREAHEDVGMATPKSGDLRKWARQGVLLWNSRLTTITGHANGHLTFGWRELTKEVLEVCYLQNPKTVFVFFGEQVFSGYKKVLPSDAVIFALPIPSKFTYTQERFKGSKIFSNINHVLRQTRQKPIRWYA